MRYILLLILLALASPVRAQTWTATPNTFPMPPDTAQLPLSFTADFIAPAPWLPVNGVTWDAIWPRTNAGAWYRPYAYSQPSIYQTNLYTWAYTCYESGSAGFRCRDLVRGIDRYVSCPASIQIGWMRRWRSHYNSAWPEYGLYDTAQWFTGWNTSLPLNGVAVTGSGQRVNCMYGPRTVDGPGIALDQWLWRP